jgi:hypothetical protein
MPREHHAGRNRDGALHRLAVPDLTSPTVLTMTITGIAADVLHAGTAPALGLATGLLAVVTAGAALAVRRPGPWRAG